MAQRTENRILLSWIIPVLGLFYSMFFSPSDTNAQTYAWNNVAIGGGGFVTGIIPSKTENNLMYARTDVGGAYRWDATNGKWISLLDWCSINETGYQGVEALALDPQNASRVYMLVGTSYFNGGKTAVLRSSDYGNTFAITDVTSQFTAHGNGMGRQNGERLVVDPNNANILFCGSRANGLWKSTNAGASFSLVSSLAITTTPNANGINFIVFDPTGTTGSATQTFFVGISRNTSTGPNLYKTTNGGTSFTAITGGPNLMPQRAVLASDKNLYITYADNEGPWNITSGQVWKYNTTTNAWTNITPSGFTTGFGGISVDPANANRLILSTINAYWRQYNDGTNDVWGDRILISTNGGTSWRDLVGSAGITMNANGITWIFGQSIHWAGSIEFNPFNTAQAWVISGNGVFSCDNVNATNTTWKFNSVGIEETVPLDIVSITGGPLVSVIGDYDGFKHTSITAFSPIHTPRMGTTTGLAFAALNTNTLLRVGNNMYYTTNQGTTWTQCSMNGTQGKVAVSANGGTFLHCPSGSSTLYRSTNNGASWSTCNGVSIQDAVPVADMVNNSKFYAYNSASGVMMVSTDGGANFSSSGSPGAGGSKIVRTVPGQEGHLWVAMNNGGLKRSTNSGASFTTLSGVTNCAAVGLGKAEPSSTYHTLYIWGTVGGVTGVFRSIDQGATWLRINDDDHEYGGPGNGQFVIGDMNVYGRVYMSTVGRGIVYADIDVPAPVELLSFMLSKESNQVLLHWQTASEINNDYFSIERSSDGQHFSTIGHVKGAGNSLSGLRYTFADVQPLAGLNYYRLKQVDFDGSVSYSEIKTISWLSSTDVLLYPNPAEEHFTVIAPTRIENIEVSDVVGHVVLLQHNLSSQELKIDLNSLPGGIYLVRIRTGSETVVKSFLKK